MQTSRHLAARSPCPQAVARPLRTCLHINYLLPERAAARYRDLACKASTIDTSNAEPAPKRQPLFKPDVEDEDNDATQVNNSDEEQDCSVYVDREGNMLEVMCCDYGWRSGVERMYQADGAIPTSGFVLAWKHFQEELAYLRSAFRDDDFAKIAKANPPQEVFGKALYGLGGSLVAALASLDKGLESIKLLPPLGNTKPVDPAVDESVAKECRELRAKLKQLKLSNAAVWDREHKREKEGNAVQTSWIVKFAYIVLCNFLDIVFNNRPLQRFWFLETVARMPYFSYISTLHLYESLGWWRAAAELRKIHFAEEYNELHHLQIMEALGGDRLWVDRFLAYHSAILYYFALVAIFILSPSMAYNFSELLESHAVDTYNEFAEANKDILKSLPPPLVAAQYYRSNDLYMFDEFQTSNDAAPRNPPTNNLYDVFINIRDDEGEHVKTMRACQDSSVMKDLEVRKELPRRV